MILFPIVTLEKRYRVYVQAPGIGASLWFDTLSPKAQGYTSFPSSATTGKKRSWFGKAFK